MVQDENLLCCNELLFHADSQRICNTQYLCWQCCLREHQRDKVFEHGVPQAFTYLFALILHDFFISAQEMESRVSFSAFFMLLFLCCSLFCLTWPFVSDITEKDGDQRFLVSGNKNLNLGNKKGSRYQTIRETVVEDFQSWKIKQCCVISLMSIL